MAKMKIQNGIYTHEWPDEAGHWWMFTPEQDWWPTQLVVVARDGRGVLTVSTQAQFYYERSREGQVFAKATLPEPPRTERYTRKIKFTVTNKYGCGPRDEDDVYTVAEFREAVEERAFTDCDGHGRPVKDSKCDPQWIVNPSEVDQIPADATHVVWYNQ